MNSSRQRISNQATLKEGAKAPPSQYSISLAEFYVKKIILVLVGIFVPVFTIWNVYDFCARGSRSTAFSIGTKKKPLRCYGEQGSQCPRCPYKYIVAI